jgi:hypothetical protein
MGGLCRIHISVSQKALVVRADTPNHARLVHNSEDSKGDAKLDILPGGPYGLGEPPVDEML